MSATTSIAMPGTGMGPAPRLAQVPVRPIAGAFAGALAASAPVTFLDIVDGELIVPMGGVLSIASPAAGTSCIVVAGITYAEIPC